jgi:hypothetical protein
LNRIILAFKAFFALLFTGQLPSDLIGALGLIERASAPKAAPAAPPKPQLTASDGALQLLGILQRDARILDFFMEDLSPYTDEQIGTAARQVHGGAREILTRCFAPVPVIDAVEGSSVASPVGSAALVKFVGNVPATGTASSGLLRHKGWKATSTDIPQLNTRQDLAILAPAEIEVE